MSITKIISNEEVTLVQSVNGLFLCEESWISQRRKAISEKNASDEEVMRMEKRHANAECSHTDLLDLT